MAKVTGSAGLQDKHLSSERSRVKPPGSEAPRHSPNQAASAWAEGGNMLTRFFTTGDDA